MHKIIKIAVLLSLFLTTNCRAAKGDISSMLSSDRYKNINTFSSTIAANLRYTDELAAALIKVASEQLFNHLIVLTHLPNFDEFKNVQVRDTGNTALHIVTDLQNIPMVKALIKAGCNQFIKNILDRDPATLAMNRRNEELLELFKQSQQRQISKSSLTKTDFLRKQFKIPESFPVQLNFEQLETIRRTVNSDSTDFILTIGNIRYLGTIQEQAKDDVDQSFVWRFSKSLPKLVTDYLKAAPSCKKKDTIFHGYIKAANSQMAIYRVVVVSYVSKDKTPTKTSIDKFYKVRLKRMNG